MLCGEMGRFLYEARPDLFPEGYLTSTELAVWTEYYSWKNKAAKSG